MLREFEMARPPAARISAATSSAGPASPVSSPRWLLPRSFTRTAAPSLAAMSATSRPMPRPPPVTSTTFPSRIPIIVSNRRKTMPVRPAGSKWPRGSRSRATLRRRSGSARRLGRSAGPPTPPRSEARPALENPQRQPRRQRAAQLGAPGQLVLREGLGRQDRLRRLGVGADDDRVGHLLQPPAGGDAGDLAHGVLAVAAGADHGRVGPPLDPAEHGVVAAVEELLHRSRQRRQVLRA